MPSLQEALDRYLQLDRSTFTVKTYGSLLKRMAAAVGPARDISRVSVEDIEDWFYPLINGQKPLKRTTATEYLNVMQRFFAFCQKRSYVTVSPVESIRVRHDEELPNVSRAIPPADLRKMMKAIEHVPRDYAIVMFFLVTGCRTGGITSLTRSNLHLDQYRARVKEKGGRWVWVRFGKATAAALRAWLAVRPQSESDAVFVTSAARGAKALTRHGYRALVENLSRKTCGRVYRPHSLRHSRGHSLAWNGVPESVTGAVLNHRSSDSTRHYYPDDDDTVSSIVQTYELSALEDVERIEKILILAS